MESQLGLFLYIAGFIIGLGAVTVIDIHGLLGRKSPYWTEATTRTHKVTKPLIWLGTLLVILGSWIFYAGDLSGPLQAQLIFSGLLILNGCFLSFRVSPFLLQREKENQAAEILPASWQNKIALSFILSVIGWWGSVILLVVNL